MKQPVKFRRDGFTLVEMAVVLVVIGLMTGGILIGRNLIKAAEQRSVVSELKQYQMAAEAFKDKYGALPGDMPNATTYWGRADGVAGGGQCTTPITDMGTAPQTCNGDGSSTVTFNHGGTYGASEMFRFWQHLSNGGFLEGRFTGVKGSGDSWDTIFGTNAPKSRYPNAGWIIFHFQNQPGDAGVRYAIDYGNYFHLGSQTTGSWPQGYPFTPEAAWLIDGKVDDAQPGEGSVIIEGWNACTLAASSTDLTAGYDLSIKNQVCRLIFRRQFM